MAKIISHNTFSYLPVKNKVLKPFSFIAQCQDNIWQIQCAVDNIQGIDLRVRFDDYDRPVIAHGMIEYEGNIFNILDTIYRNWVDRIFNTGEFTIRVMLETQKCMSSDERERQKHLFQAFCTFLVPRYPKILFWGGWPRDEWRKKVYDFHTTEPSVTEMHGSVSGNKLNCLWLKCWAKKHNPELRETCKTEYLIIDYVEY